VGGWIVRGLDTRGNDITADATLSRVLLLLLLATRRRRDVSCEKNKPTFQLIVVVYRVTSAGGDDVFGVFSPLCLFLIFLSSAHTGVVFHTVKLRLLFILHLNAYIYSLRQTHVRRRTTYIFHTHTHTFIYI